MRAFVFCVVFGVVVVGGVVGGAGCAGSAASCGDLALKGGEVCSVDFSGCSGGDIHVVCAVGEDGDNCSCDVGGGASTAFHDDVDPCGLDRAGLNAFVADHCAVADD